MPAQESVEFMITGKIKWEGKVDLKNGKAK